MTSAKLLDFFVPPCQVHKSADFVPFVCFLRIPLPVRMSNMEAPKRGGNYSIHSTHHSVLNFETPLAKMRSDESERNSAASLFTLKGCFVIFGHGQMLMRGSVVQ